MIEFGSLTSQETQRYSRHLLLPQVGLEGQLRLKASTVLLVGVGGLGSPLALYLAAAGIGKIVAIDPDLVDESNLQRQLLYGQSDVGILKVEAAKNRLQEMNPHIEIKIIPDRFSIDNALKLVSSSDVVADGTDNFATRYLVNDACVMANVPNVHGSIYRFEGQLSVFGLDDGPCYRCLFPEPPPADSVPSCAEAGVLGVLPGLVGTIQATEVVKIILGIGNTLSGRLLIYDALRMSFREVKVNRNQQCAICGTKPTITELNVTNFECKQPEVKPQPMQQPSLITPEEVKSKLETENSFCLLDVRNQNEYSICRIEGSTLIPLPELPARVNELDPDTETIVFCKIGPRAFRACEFLVSQGFTNLKVMEGSITAWRDRIDPTLASY